MIKKTTALMLLFLCSAQAGQSHKLARHESPAAPADPQIAPLPDNIAFTKSFTHKNPGKKQKKAIEQFKSQFPQVVKLEVLKTGQTRKETESYTDGNVMEKWKSGAITFTVSSSAPDQIMVAGPGMTQEGTGDSEAESDFAELAWINRSSFHGEEVREGMKCFVYKMADQTAWIEQATRLPVFFRTPKLEIAYTFNTPPDQPLQLPDKFTKKLETVKRAWMGRSN